LIVRDWENPILTAPPRVDGRLHLRFDRDPASDATRMIAREQQPPLRVVRSFGQADGSAAVHLHNVSGGVLGGDHLHTRIDVGGGARAQLTTTGATRVYRSRNGQNAIQTTEVRIERDGLLEYVPDPLIPFAGSRFGQHTRIELAPGAGVIWAETIAPGRAACGEMFAYDLLHLTLEICADERPIAIERVLLEPHDRSPTSLARFGPYCYSASFYICRTDRDPANWLAWESQLSDLAERLTAHADQLWGVSALAAHGLVVRGLSVAAPPIARGLPLFWREAKLLVYGQEPVMPRKLY
jgi:urease accessory protein